MNGFILLVVLAATAQVAGPAPAPTAERDYGWQISPEDGLLEFIVQLSPEKANLMLANNKEFQSHVPADVAVRISRVVVCIGRDPILSAPMEDVLRLPVRSAAALANVESVAGRGRFSDLESAPSGGIVNVGGTNAPPALSGAPAPLPGAASLNPSTLGSDSGPIADRASELLNALPNALRQGENLLAQNGVSNFMNEARGAGAGANTGKFSNTGTPPPTTLPTAPGTMPQPNSGPLASTPTAPPPTMPAYPAATTTTPPTTPGMSPIGTTGGAGVSGGVGGYQQPGAIGSPGYTGAPVYSDPYAHSNTGSAPINTGNFGTPPRSAGQTPTGQYATTTNPWGTTNSSIGSYNPSASSTPSQIGSYPNQPGYGQQGYNPLGNSVYANDPLSLPGSPTYRVADNRDVPGLPTTGSSSTFPNPTTGASTSTFPTNTVDPRQVNSSRVTNTTTDPNYPAQYPSGRSGMENVVPVMFVLSLVVNFYLGMLIRKLLTRYRSLLSSVRSQTV